jgi:hypothetical protein
MAPAAALDVFDEEAEPLAEDAGGDAAGEDGKD